VNQPQRVYAWLLVVQGVVGAQILADSLDHATRQIGEVSSFEDLVKRDFVHCAAYGLSLLPKLAEVSRATVRTSARSFRNSEPPLPVA
jgi:hypothetical protein